MRYVAPREGEEIWIFSLRLHLVLGVVQSPQDLVPRRSCIPACIGNGGVPDGLWSFRAQQYDGQP